VVWPQNGLARMRHMLMRGRRSRDPCQRGILGEGFMRPWTGLKPNGQGLHSRRMAAMAPFLHRARMHSHAIVSIFHLRDDWDSSSTIPNIEKLKILSSDRPRRIGFFVNPITDLGHSHKITKTRVGLIASEMEGRAMDDILECARGNKRIFLWILPRKISMFRPEQYIDY